MNGRFICVLIRVCFFVRFVDVPLVAFRMYDMNGDGVLRREELVVMFGRAWIAGLAALAVEHNLVLEDSEIVDFAEETATLFADRLLSSLDTNGT